jgi:lipoprotein signal peptidase
VSFYSASCVWNYGVSFGVGSSLNNSITVLLTVIVLVSLVVYQARFPDKIIRTLILATAIGGGFNLIDRLRYGAVCDYINLLGELVFNLNDIVIVGSLLTLFIYVIYKSRF